MIPEIIVDDVMRFVSFEKPMFRVALQCSQQDRVSLLDFLAFCQREEVQARLLRHPLGPSDVWTSWARETYIGFSSERVLLQSGHHFASAELATQAPRRWWKRPDGPPDADGRLFARSYPGVRVPAVHQALCAAHPSVYWRTMEAVTLSGRPTADRLLEIGAGAGVRVAYRHLLHPTMRTVVIDLPETMAIGYCLLRLCGLDVALPNEEREAAIVMRFPFQSIDGPFDLAFNMSSFQEMTLETVQRYITLIHARLRPGGVLHHVNLTHSRQMTNNIAASYDLSVFETVSVQSAPYHSAIAQRPVVSVTAQR